MIKRILITLAATVLLLTGNVNAQPSNECKTGNINQVYEKVQSFGGKAKEIFTAEELRSYLEHVNVVRNIDFDYAVAFYRTPDTDFLVVYFKEGCYVSQEAIAVKNIESLKKFIGERV